MEEDLTKKAILTLGGAVLLPEGYQLPTRISHSTAGPGAGFGSFAFRFGDFRVKKSVSYEKGEFELGIREDGGLFLTRGGEPFLDEIVIDPIVRHCPEQAFFNLDPRCMFHCVYCNSPNLDMSQDKHLSTEKIMDMLEESFSDHTVKAISFTSGVVGSIDRTVERFVEVVSEAHSRYPDVPIGVEPYVSTREQVQALKDAGADEIKVNLEAARKDIFVKVCPDLDYDAVWAVLPVCVEVFGKGKVISNVIYGLGETDDDLRVIMERLCSIGVIPGLRALRSNGMNGSALEKAIGEIVPVTSERVLRLARMQKEIMSEHGLSGTSETMCMGCGCCDLVPFKDL